jgi:hypothetical protein
MNPIHFLIEVFVLINHIYLVNFDIFLQSKKNGLKKEKLKMNFIHVEVEFLSLLIRFLIDY